MKMSPAGKRLPTSKKPLNQGSTPILPLAIASCGVLGMLLLRIGYARQASFLFLSWNLFLAWIPLLLSLLSWRCRRHSLLAIALGILWLLFLPNAPYLVSDLIHLKPGGVVPMWYDLGMLFAFAFVGLALGLHSLHIMQALVKGRFGPLAGWCFVLAAAVLSGLGVYIGRFLRWNSWELLQYPEHLASDLLATLATPASTLKLLAVVFLFGALTVVGLLIIPAGQSYRGDPSQHWNTD
jgi:uncharacterized membrane protein